MKILVLNPDRLSNPTGGIGTSFRELYKRLKYDVDFYVVGYPDPDSPVEQYRSAITSLKLEHGGVAGLLCHSIYIMEALKFGIIPDAVHAHDWSVYFAAAELAEYFKVPLIVTMQTSPKVLMQHDIFFCDNNQSIDGSHIQATHLEIEEYGLQKATHIINASKSFAKQFPEHDYKTTVIPLGINLSDWENPNQITLPGEKEFKIVYTGRIAAVKGLEFLLNAQIPSNVDVIILGDKDEVEEFAIAHLESTEGFHIMDRAYGQDYIDLLCAADAVIIPSLHEPFGAAGLEALASKSILISSRADGLGDYLNWNNSVHTEVSHTGIEQAYETFLSMSVDEKEQMINNGLKTCLQYDWDDIAKMYLDVYKKTIDK